MLNKNYKTPFAAMLFIALAFLPSLARSAETVEEYDPSGSMFQMITDLEQEKVIWQLEKEKAQLQLDMDRMAAEQMRLKNEMDAMQGSGNTQAEALELERQRLEIEKQKLEAQRKNIDESGATQTPTRTSAAGQTETEEPSPIQEKYRLIEIIGAGRQLLATVEDNATGQRKKISVGKDLDGYRIDSVSLDEGVLMSKDGQVAVLGIHADQQ